MKIRRRPPNPSVKVANLEYAIPHKESEPRNILERIIWQKDKEVSLAKKQVSIQDLQGQIDRASPTRGFIDSLRKASSKPAVIAEVKKASPSKGVIREDFDPLLISNAYKKGGATCLSVLTDHTFFQGGFDVLSAVRKNVDLPILCKDFVFTPYQLYQARAAGADAILFIAAILSDEDFYYLSEIARKIDLDILVEVHDSKELERVLRMKLFKLIGINNRDLETFHTDLAVTEKLAKEYEAYFLDSEYILVSESGIASRIDLERVSQAGAKAVLIGESLMRNDDIEVGLRKLIQ